MHVLILKPIYPACNFLSSYLYAKHALVYICCLNSVYRMKFALHAAVQQICYCANLIGGQYCNKYSEISTH